MPRRPFIPSGRNNGFGLIEIIIAIALYLSIATFSISAVVGSFSSNRLAEEQTQATFYARQGMEAARSIRNQGWDDTFLSTDCSVGCGISSAGGQWSWLGSSTNYGTYELNVAVNPVERDGNNTIVESGGTNDPDTKKVIATVSWDFTPTRTNTVQLETYLTNFRKTILALGNWMNIVLRSSVDMRGGQDALKVQHDNQYAYIIRSSNTDSLSIYDTSDPVAPQQVSSLAISGSSLRNIFVLGDYVYLVDAQNASELRIVSVADPVNPVSVGTYNLPGNGDGNGVFVVGSTTYVVRSAQGNNPTFHILNTSNPATITEIGSLTLQGNALEIVVSGEYAYVSSSNDTEELQVISLANPANPVLVGSLDLPGTDDAGTISLYGSTVFIGQGNNLRVIDVSTPAAPALVASLDLGGVIHDLSLELAAGEYLFAATANANAEFHVVDLSTIGSPVSAATLDILGNNTYYGVAYSSSFDQAIAVGSSNTEEIVIITPN